jgi:PPP family 3-phenylpropionic acid transporter
MLERDRREELRLSTLTAAVYAVVGVQLPFFPLWLASRGLEAGEIGVIVGAPPAIRIISTLLASRYADRTGRHASTLVGFALAAGLAYGLMGFASGFFPILAAVVLLAFAQAPIGILSDGIILGAAQRRRATGRPALHYSFVRGWGSVSILALMLLSGPIAQALPNSALVWLLTIVSFAAALAALLALRGSERIGANVKHDAPSQELARPALALGVIASAALIQGSHAMAFAFASLHWKATGHDENFVSLAWAAALITEVGLFLAAGRWFGGEGRASAYLTVGGLGALARWLLMASDPSGVGVLLAQALHGLSCAAVQLGPAYLLARLCGTGRLAQAQAWLAAANAATLSIATFACGPLYVEFGERGYYVMAAMAGLGLVLSLLLGRDLQGQPSDELVASASGERRQHDQPSEPVVSAR